MKKQSSLIIAAVGGAIGLLAIGGLVGWVSSRNYFLREFTGDSHTVREDSGQFEFINPYLFGESSKDLYAPEFKPLNSALSADIKKVTDNHSADSVSVYYRDLNSGHWTGVNEDEKYEPSSMLKVVTMMATLQAVIKDSAVGSATLYYRGPDDSGQYYKPNDALKTGYYGLNDLISAMIKYSDNGADEALLSDPAINVQFLDISHTFNLPVLSGGSASSTSDFMSARSYSVLFRTLYNGAFFPENLCEQILRLLSSTSFTQGLVAGIPTDIVVSHKFGEHTFISPADGSVNRQLHDCGIVYYPNHPYFLCVMTRGDDFTKLATVISGISKSVYAYVQGLSTGK